MNKSKDSDLQKKIIDYLMDHNRPFSLNDIFNNLSMGCGKTAMTRILLLLVSEDKVTEKTYGKQKVYYVNQNLFYDSKHDDMHSMDAQINELSNTLNSLQKQINCSETVLEDLNKSLPTEIAEAELKAVKSEILVLKDKMQSLESKSDHLDSTERKKLYNNKEMCVRAFQRRKRLASNIIDAILEGYPKSKKHLLEELGVETDDKKF